jgi:hypothetical protein
MGKGRARWLGLLTIALFLCPRARGDEPIPLSAVLSANTLPDKELRQHWSPNAELARRLRKFMRMRADESLEVRSFSDQDIHRRMRTNNAGGVPSALPQEGTKPAFFGLTQISESRQPPWLPC